MEDGNQIIIVTTKRICELQWIPAEKDLKE